MKNKFLLTLAALAWLAISTVLLTLPGDDIPSEGWFFKLLDRIWFDKWVHVGLFAILAFLFCVAWRSLKTGITSTLLTKHFVVVGILATIYGVIMEFVQLYLVTGRSFDTMDIIADGAGAAIGTVFSIRRYIKK